MQPETERRFAANTYGAHRGNVDGCPAYTAIGDMGDVWKTLSFSETNVMVEIGDASVLASTVYTAFDNYVKELHVRDVDYGIEYFSDCGEYHMPEETAREAWFDVVEAIEKLDEDTDQAVERARQIADTLGWTSSDDCDTETTVVTPAEA